MKTVLATVISILLATSVYAATGDKDHKDKFQKLDTDGNGAISLEEAREADIEEATFNRYDVDGNGELSEQEYMAMKKESKQQRNGGAHTQ